MASVSRIRRVDMGGQPVAAGGIQSIGTWSRPASPALIEAEIARTIRAAWTDDGLAIAHDMGRAKEIWRAQIRHERAAVLPLLDGQCPRAFGQGKADEAAVIEAKRQALRDLPADPRIAAAKIVEALKAIEVSL